MRIQPCLIFPEGGMAAEEDLIPGAREGDGYQMRLES